MALWLPDQHNSSDGQKPARPRNVAKDSQPHWESPLWDSRASFSSSLSVLCLCATLDCCEANSTCTAAIKQTNDCVAAGLRTMHFQSCSTKPTKITLLFSDLFWVWVFPSQLPWPSHIHKTLSPRSLLRTLLVEHEACLSLSSATVPIPPLRQHFSF